ncbi:MAG: sigma-70 family RNA polymerase sigma factor [Bacteroidetes bacterium]|nr:sigma-70 family RNA polymerase sigma factor [Bacteroidota bacterium]
MFPPPPTGMSSRSLTDTDRKLLNQIKAGQTGALEQLYVQALHIATEEMGVARLVHDYLQEAVLALKKAIQMDRVDLRGSRSLAEYLARLVHERWENTLKNQELDQKIIATLQSDKDSGWAFYYMQRHYFPGVSYFVRGHGGTEEDAKDIIMDGIYALLSNVRAGKYTPTDSASLKTYFFSICKNKWRDYQKKKKNNPIADPIEGLPDSEGEVHYYAEFDEDLLNERQKMVADIFGHAGEKCHRILSYFYYENLSHEQIAERMGYEGPNTSKEQKKRCMNKIRDLVLKRFQDLQF